MDNQHPLIEQYIALLKAENEIHNLYSKTAYEKIPFHIHDCAYLAGLITNDPLDVLDMGSGAGLPSIIIAILNPRNTVIAVESKTKKYNFLFHVKQTLGLTNYFPVNDDINAYISSQNPTPHFITAKAFAPYEKLMKICKKVSRKNHPRLIVPISEAQAIDLSRITQIHRAHQTPELYYINTHLK